MTPVQYHFRTDWIFKAELERVWSVITDIEQYPAIWPDFRKIQIRKGDGRSVGSVFDCTVRGALPYSLNYSMEVIRAEEPHRIELSATGDLVGSGRWEFSSPRPNKSLATYYWDVGTTNPILNLLAPLARGFFAKNHNDVMARGYTALGRRIETQAS